MRGPSRIDGWRGQIRERVGQLLNRLGVPGYIRPGSISTPRKENINIQVGPLFTRVIIDGPEFSCDLYFDRLSGSYDGTRSSLT
jgi:hypothetical protein